MTDRMRKILESKRAQRRRLRALSFSEKVKLLEKLRERSLAIARSPLRRRQRTKVSPAIIRKERHAPPCD
jgi:hypothetical protein